MIASLAAAYRAVVLEHPRAVLVALALLLAFFGYHTKDFRLDASADSLLLETDPDLQRFREVNKRYRSRELLVVTFTPAEDLFSDEVLSRIGKLGNQLRGVAGVDSVTTILGIPLLESSDVPLSKMADDVQTLAKPGVDRDLAREEIRASPIFRNLILSEDARTTAVLINMKEDESFRSLQEERNDLFSQRRAGSLDETEQRRLDELLPLYDRAHAALSEQRHDDVAAIREILAPYRQHAVVHLGGVPMITDDMIAFVKKDLVIFGAGVLVFLMVVLTVIFRQARWVLLPLLSCFYAGLTMIGMLGPGGLEGYCHLVELPRLDADHHHLDEHSSRGALPAAEPRLSPI